MNRSAGTASSETGTLQRVLMKRPESAFREAAKSAVDWRRLGFTAPPDPGKASEEHARLVETVRAVGAEVLFLPDSPADTMDSIYARDASVPAERGVILCRMGKPARSAEPEDHGRFLSTAAVSVLGRIEPPGTLEGGDVVWLDGNTLAVGRTYRTNEDGIRQLRQLVGEDTSVLAVPMPHWRGPADVFHLMSVISPLAPDLAVVYSPLLPVPFRELLLERGLRLVEVPDDELETMGANVLALSPDQCVMWEGSPGTRERIERAGVEVVALPGTEIGRKGGGGPTCLVRPLLRAVV